MPKGSLPPRQRRFVQEYLVDLNATQAAIRAGYSAKTADVAGPRLLGNVRIAQAVAEGQAKVGARLEITAERVLKELARLAFLDIGTAFESDGRMKALADIPEDTRRAIAGLEIEEMFDGRGEERVLAGQLRKVKLADKTRTLELLGRHLGMFRDKVELSGPNGGPIQTQALDLTGLSDDELVSFRQLADKAGATGGRRGAGAPGDHPPKR